jgi:pSer/pThr/pTyr-binding forkhead associated (FHA) protein
VRVEPDRVVVVDANSANGTFVNDVRLSPGIAHELAAGDVLSLGSDPPLRLQVTAANSA